MYQSPCATLIKDAKGHLISRDHEQRQILKRYTITTRGLHRSTINKQTKNKWKK